MSAYKLVFLEAITVLGLKKALSELLTAGAIVDERTVGQVICHINSGGIIKIVLTAEVK